jgi:hypothetical protein
VQSILVLSTRYTGRIGVVSVSLIALKSEKCSNR